MEVSLSNKSNNPNPNSSSFSSSVRVLVRSSQSSTSKTHPVLTDPSPSSSSNGVVVVGFIGPRPVITTHLINRIVDANVFGSGNSDQSLFADKEELRDWFKSRRISYHHDEQKGVLFLQFFSSSCFAFVSAMEEEELEFGDLQGMLFMFSVCHVIIHIQDGLRFDTQLLKKFRVLQAAKHGLAPFSRSQITAGLASKLLATSASPPPLPRPSNNNSSPGKSRGVLSRTGSSSASLMSGLGSYASLFPGQCTPVMLFVFIEDFSDTSNPTSNVKESIDTTASHSQSNLPAKVSGPVVVLARPASKSEGGFRKKLQSSLETQVRFLIKKCRTLLGPETGHGGSRTGGGVSSSVPLFSLDSSRAVILLDRSANRVAKSLDFATGLVEDVLNGKATTDSLLLESHGQIDSNNKEDIQLVKDFIYRQCDILRGKGSVIANPTSGVGMVAVAAAAAAASAGKVTASPELPNMEAWLSSSRVILDGILSAKGEVEVTKRKPRPRNGIPPVSEGVVASSSKGSDPFDVAVSWLGSGKGIDSRFSTWWCERNLPAAKEVYLKDLPGCYPTPTHEAHLEKALLAFRSMVKGPAVGMFAQKLENECTAVWKSGRQLCDAVSLTGRPCMHKRHDDREPHCSGFVFLHACACGRSRKTRLDPFDFESADFSSSDCFADCDKLLPSLELPKLTGAGPVQMLLSWSLIRVGGAKYYDPSKGLLQSGFCVTQKFLSKWEVLVENPISQNGLTVGAIESSEEPKFEPKASTSIITTVVDVRSGVENQRKPSQNVMVVDEKKISFGKGLPNATMKKPFAEVVAGSGFPPLQQRKQHAPGPNKPSKIGDPTVELGSRKSEGTLTPPSTLNTNGEPYLRIGSYAGPIYHNNPAEKVRKNPSFTSIIAYVGFEHECPRGHRFLLNPDHLKELGSFYQLPEESRVQSSGNNTSDHRPASSDSKLNNNNGRRGKARQNSNKARKERSVDDNGYPDLNISFGVSKLEARDFGRDFRASLDCVRFDDDDGQKQALSMLNRDLPLYMNCPHCGNSRNSREVPKVNFAGTVSQLQRIFLVTPPYPIVLSTSPVIQFEASCLSPSVQQREEKLRFSLGCEVVLPPESFLTLRLPFVYGVEMDGGDLHPLKCFENQPEATAWISKGTVLNIISKINSVDQ